MTCGNENNPIADNLLEYCAGTLDESASAKIEAHLRECRACEQLVSAQRATLSVLDEWQPPAVSEDFDARLYQRIAVEKQGNWAKRWWNGIRASGLSPIWKPAIPIGAAAVALSVGLLLRTPPSPILSVAPVPPAVSIEPVSTSAQTVDADQLESALDDLDMLTPMPRKGAI